MTAQTISTSGIDVTFDVRGSGPLVVFVQGGAATQGGYWLDLVDETAAVATVVTLDRPGTGLSPVEGSFHLADQAKDLAAVIEAVDAGPALIVGHSLGGPVSVQLAADRPDLVSGLVLLDPSPFNDTGQLKAANAIFGPLAFAERAPKVLAAPILAAFRALVSKGMAKELKGVGRPMTPAVRASLDTVFDHQQASQCIRLLAHLPEDGAALTARLEAQPLTAGGVLVTAERKVGHRATKAHAEQARLAGLELLTWKGGHSLHISNPERSLELVTAQVKVVS